jgi:glycosyltransferase involved in cell wall biosynthesis
VGAYQRKIEEIALDPEAEVVAIVPPSWDERSGQGALERLHLNGYRLIVSPIAFNGRFHFFFFPHLGRLLDECQPDLLHIDEEPYNLATFLAIQAARRRGIPALFFTWQNLHRRYPPPFAWVEHSVYRRAAWAIAGTETAARVLRTKGYRGGVSVVPQFGVDTDAYAPGSHREIQVAQGSTAPVFVIGYAGRLVREKGVSFLVEACAQLQCPFRVVITGSGPAQRELDRAIKRHGLGDRFQFNGSVPSAQMPARLRELDVLVLPSLSQHNWAEQFGRVLVEAMACGVPVVGSRCGEIPWVVGDAGLIFPEGDSKALASCLQQLASDRALCAELGRRGRARVLEHFTHRKIAQDTLAISARTATTANAAPQCSWNKCHDRLFH